MNDHAPEPANPPIPKRRRIWPLVLGGLVVVIALPILLWDWNWLRPLVERQATLALGRSVSLRHLTVSPGWQTTLVAESVVIINPDGFDAETPFATIERLSAVIDIKALLRDRSIVIPTLRIEHAQVEIRSNAEGVLNSVFPVIQSQETATAATSAPAIGDVEVTDGRVHVVVAATKSDFAIVVATIPPAAGKPSQLTAEATGVYAGQPITGHMTGGALMSLRDTAVPYPVDIHIANGPTRIVLTGTLADPIALTGADLKLELTGPNMALLMPWAGFAIPKTPSYKIIGKLDTGDGKVLFRDFTGTVGSSDIEGSIAVASASPPPGLPRPVMTGTMASRQIDLADLGGFIGSEPGRMDTPNQTAEQHAAMARAVASPQMMPTIPINIPVIRQADIHLTYRGAKILGRSMPFDSITAKLDIDDGRIRLTPVTLGVGSGKIIATLDLTPQGDQVRTVADINFQRLDVGRMLAATHLVQGSGVLGGHAAITSTGNSMATLLSRGDGAVQLFMAGGGDLSALLVDISGFQIGNAVLSALGIPNRTPIHCFVGDFTLQRGLLNTRTLLLDTKSDIITGTGSINLATETLNLRLKTDSKHFSVGTLPAPIAVTGPFKDPSIRPDIATLGARAGAATGLGILFPPAALLPTIQFGVGDDNSCTALTRRGSAAK